MKVLVASLLFSLQAVLATTTADVLSNVASISTALNAFSAAVTQGLSIPPATLVSDGVTLTDSLKNGAQILQNFTTPISTTDGQTIMNAVQPLVPVFQSTCTAWSSNGQIYKTVSGLPLQLFELAENMDIAWGDYGTQLNDLIVPLGGSLAGQAFVDPVIVDSALDDVSNTYFQILDS